MNQQTMKLLKSGAAGIARSVQGKGGAHMTRQPADARSAAKDDELAEGVAEYFEKKAKKE
jgi:hypothetical protein